jgi:hypothetical protein
MTGFSFNKHPICLVRLPRRDGLSSSHTSHDHDKTQTRASQGPMSHGPVKECNLHVVEARFIAILVLLWLKGRRNTQTMVLAGGIIRPRLAVVILIISKVPLQTPSQERHHPAKQQRSIELYSSVE